MKTPVKVSRARCRCGLPVLALGELLESFWWGRAVRATRLSAGPLRAFVYTSAREASREAFAWREGDGQGPPAAGSRTLRGRRSPCETRPGACPRRQCAL